MVAHTCNISFVGVGGRRIVSSKPAQGKIATILFLKKEIKVLGP
jgi:hypothetical protein